MPAPLYLDLFDDGIPRPGHNPLDRPGDFEARAADTLRFQILVAVLFERQIVVPEAWAVSSPMFLRVVGDFLEKFPKHVETSDAIGPKRTETRSPFVFAFGPEAGTGSTAQKYARSLLWRVRSRRRLMFSSGLSGGLGASDEAGLRDALCDELAPLVAKGGQHLLDVPDALRTAMERAGESQLAEQAALQLTAVLNHLVDRRSLAAQSFDQARYDLSLIAEVERVRETTFALLSPARAETLEVDLSGVGRFFEQVRDERLSSARIMTLWQRLRGMDIPDADKRTLEAFGRFVLNRAYASVLGASHSSAISFDAYAQGASEAGASTLLDHLMLRASPAGDARAHDFVAMAAGEYYDLADTFDWHQRNWKPTWETVAAFAVSPGWRADRERIVDRIREMPLLTRVQTEAWQDVFDRINAALHGHIRLLPQGHVVALVREAKESAGRLAQLAGAVTSLTGLDTVTQLPLEALAQLLGLGPADLPAYLSLKAERAARRPLAHPLGSAMLALLS